MCFPFFRCSLHGILTGAFENTSAQSIALVHILLVLCDLKGNFLPEGRRRWRGSFYGEDLTKSERLWVEGDCRAALAMTNVEVAPRIGIPYAKEWENKLLR